MNGHFDAASTEPLHPAARDVLIEAHDEGWSDPARLYGSARKARVLLDNAREIVAAVLDCRPDEVSFTSSGTQSVHLGVLGAYAARERSRTGVVVSAVEHSSVLQSAAHLDTGGAGVRHVGVDRHGLIDDAEFGAAVDAGTALACLQAANHEVGTIQPVEQVAAGCAEYDVPLVTDAAQVVGRDGLPHGWSILAASAHKWGGPAGVGVLAVRRGVRWRSPWPADEREGGRVPGFENVAGALAAAAALRARTQESDDLAAEHHALIEHLRTSVPARIADVDLAGHPTRRLPHLVTFSCLYLDGESLVTELDRAGFSVSSGSSCTASTLRPSHVLEAMGALTHGNIRVSLSRDVSRADVERFVTVLSDVVTRQRQDVGSL